MPAANILGKWDNAHFTYNAVDLSDHVRGGTLSLQRGEVELAAMGDDWSEWDMQRGQATLTLQVLQNFYTSEFDATIYPDIATVPSGGRAIVVGPIATGATTINPYFQFNGFIRSYNPLDGNYDEAMQVPLEIRVTGTLTRATS